VAQVLLENLYKSFPKVGHRTLATAQPALEEQPEETPVAHGAVLRGVSLRVEDGEFMVLVGPSGCGKSTLLRLIAGLETATGGQIWVGDRQVNALPPKDRDIAMVFQSYALYPHMTVYENLAFGLRRTIAPHQPELAQARSSATPSQTQAAWKLILQEKLADILASATRKLPGPLRYWSARERWVDDRVQAVAKMLQIEMLLDRLPRQLSGGQKQRVALGRAIARNPAVFLMDEPLSNLDAKLRTETRSQIVALQRQLGITTIYVTHDQIEAMTMGDRIAVLYNGQLQQVASPLELYHRPANQFVAGFIGSPPMNFLSVQFIAPQLISHDRFRLTLPDHWASALAPYDGQALVLGIRPEHLSLSPPAPKNLAVQIDRIEALGSETYLSVTLEPEKPNTKPTYLQARVAPDPSLTVGQTIWLSLQVDEIHLFEPATQRAIALR